MDMEEVVYCNTGDWVENCSALVEHQNGKLELIRRDGTLIDSLPARVQPKPCSVEKTERQSAAALLQHELTAAHGNGRIYLRHSPWEPFLPELSAETEQSEQETLVA